MESATTKKTSPVGQGSFTPIKDITDNLDEVSVGHAGIYPISTDENDNYDPGVIEPIIDIGAGKGKKILLDVEDGVKTFVQDALASKSNSELEKYGLSNDMERVSSLPNKMTGVLIHYLTEGIERDFGITWTKTPVSIQNKNKKQSKAEVARKEGKRGLSKQEKNDIMEKQDMKYWRPLIEDGKITKEEAYEEIDKMYAEQKYWESEGFYFSPKKTEGLLMFDYKKEVSKANNRENGFKVYSRNDLSVVIPNVIENYYMDEDSKNNKKMIKDIEKTFLGSMYFSSIDDVLKEDWGDMNVSKKELLEHKINGLHIVKIMKSGMMKDRWLCFDCDDKKTGKQVLHLFCGAHHMTIPADEVKDA